MDMRRQMFHQQMSQESGSRAGHNYSRQSSNTTNNSLQVRKVAMKFIARVISTVPELITTVYMFLDLKAGQKPFVNLETSSNKAYSTTG